jgi:isocitrate/isopropylmalate dehydrogenase
MRNLALDIARSDRVNPTGLLLASAAMLRHMQMTDASDRIRNAVHAVLREGKGSGTRDYTRAVIAALG